MRAYFKLQISLFSTLSYTTPVPGTAELFSSIIFHILQALKLPYSSAFTLKHHSVLLSTAHCGVMYHGPLLWQKLTCCSSIDLSSGHRVRAHCQPNCLKCSHGTMFCQWNTGKWNECYFQAWTSSSPLPSDWKHMTFCSLSISSVGWTLTFMETSEAMCQGCRIK